ncbi:MULTISPECIES: acyltransferase family protein [unclassified Nocardioides]|uniref:acyltransferase family protein n=1 Tax=Nocardioides sp. URHA0032 TaxID=1380388 RepID=UPI000AE64229|nr:acyltransferase family protein [Nocardioides sp. URHA0032]
MPSWSYRPELDGLRSVAVYLVLFFHAGMTWLEGGFIGVDLFFVLSGFLVSSVVLAEIDEHGRFGVGSFYARRVRRLLPAAVVVVIVTAFVQLLVASQVRRADMIGDAQAALLYVANWHFISDAQDYFASATADQSPFVHFWSLSIEEQFYIVFPLLVAAVWKLSRRPARTLVWTLVVVTALSVSLQLYRGENDATYAYYATDTRIYQLTAGVLLALVMRRLAHGERGRRSATAPPNGARLALAAAIAGLTSLAVLGSGLLEMGPSWRGIGATVGSVVAIGGLYLSPHGWPSRVLSMHVPRYLGQISYGTYLWHWPVILVVGEVFAVRPLVLALLAGGVATGLAALSAEILERPLRRSPKLAAYGWPVVAGGLALSVTAALVIVPQVLDSPRRPAVATSSERGSALAASEQARALRRPVPEAVDLLAARRDVPKRVPVCTADDLDSCRVVAGNRQHVVLVGDSQAQMFQTAFESIAKERGWTLSMSVLAGCSWQMGLLNELSPDVEQERCRTAREDFYTEALPKMDADLVVAISMSHSSKRWERDLTAPGGPRGESLIERQDRTGRDTVAAIEAAGANLVIVKSVMGTQGFDRGGWDPLECLARAASLAECAVFAPLERPAVDGLYEAYAAMDDRIATLDLNPVICPAPPLCAPVIGTTVVWKDPDHVTATILDKRRAKIWQRIHGTDLLD